MPTVDDCVTRAKRLLNSNTRTEFDALETAIGATTNPLTIQLKYQTDGIRAGSYLSLKGTLGGISHHETLYVHSRNGEYATVQRGMDGSTILDTAAAGTLIEVEPRFTGFQIHEAVRDAIRSLPSNLYGITTITATPASTTDRAMNYDFSSTGFLHVLQALRSPRSSEDRWLQANIKVYKDSNTTDFANGYAIVLQEPYEKIVTLQITYAHPFVDSTLNLVTDLVSVVKMQSQMQDIPAIGAAASLALADEATRLDLHAAGDSRGDAAVTAGDRTRYSLVLQAQYDRRVSQEARRLMSLYGIRNDAAASAVFPTTLR